MSRISSVFAMLLNCPQAVERVMRSPLFADYPDAKVRAVFAKSQLVIWAVEGEIEIDFKSVLVEGEPEDYFKSVFDVELSVFGSDVLMLGVVRVHLCFTLLPKKTLAY